jgi:hypothetical protein
MHTMIDGDSHAETVTVCTAHAYREAVDCHFRIPVVGVIIIKRSCMGAGRNS